MSPPDLLRLGAPAKINWDLRVLGRRPDGFHELDSVMVTVGLRDELTLAIGPGIALSCSDPSLPCGEGNLVVKAALALAAAAGMRLGARIHLEKRIPAGGGMGGGSSDAAATLRGLNRLWGLDWPRERLAGVASAVGSDVAFFLWGGWCRCAGRGELVAPLPGSDDWPAVRLLLVLPPLGVPTPAVYKALEAAQWDGRADPRTPEEVAGAIRENLGRWQAQQPLSGWPRNDLTAAARRVEPRLAALQDALEKRYPGRWQMSGSGAVHFVLAQPGEEAAELEEALNSRLGGGVRVLAVTTENK